MNSALLDTNGMLALIGAIGVFIIFFGIFYRKPEQAKTTDLERVASLLEADKLSYQKGNFIKTARRYGLEVALNQADLNVSRATFIRDGFILMGAFTAIGYVISGSLIISIFIGCLGWAVYLLWLFDRRDKKRIEYEESLADMAERMASGAQLTGTIQGTIAHACTLAPEILRDDFVEVNNRLVQGATFDDATKEVKAKRGSSMLNLLFDTLGTWSRQGSTIPLNEVLEPLTQTIRSRMRARQKVTSEMTSQKMTLYIVALAPLAYMLLMRLMFDGASEAYKTTLGSVLVVVALTISCVGYILGNKILNSISSALEIGD